MNSFIINKFDLGFSYYNSLDYLIHNYSENLLLKTGVFKTSNKNKIYNIFYNRLIFPIKNLNGFVIGFSGRILNNKKPKYINSYETIFFKKSNNLYGLWESKTFIKKLNYVIFVEGYFDVLSLYQRNFKNVLSLMGLNINKNHINLIYNLTKNIFICFDNDKAGIYALKKSIIFFINNYQDLNVNYIILPKGYDPDSFVNNFNKKKFFIKIKKSFDIYIIIYLIYIKNIFKHKKNLKKKLKKFKNFYYKINNYLVKKKILYIFINNLNINLKYFFYIINIFIKKKKYLYNLEFYEKKILIIFVIYPQLIFFFDIDILKFIINKSRINFLFLEILNNFDVNLNFLTFFLKIKNSKIFFIFKSIFEIFEKKNLKDIIFLKNKYKEFIKNLSFIKKNFFKKNILQLCNLFYNYIFKYLNEYI